MNPVRVMQILGEAKKLAREYREITGKPLGITGEVAEYEAARILNLELTPARHEGYDAICLRSGRKYQIKGRCVLDESGRSQRVGKIKKSGEFDSVLLVLLDADLEANAIYEADRALVLEAIEKPGSKARNERGQLPVSTIKRIGSCIWTRECDPCSP